MRIKDIVSKSIECVKTWKNEKEMVSFNSSLRQYKKFLLSENNW